MKELLYGKTRCYYIEGKDRGILVDTDVAGTLPQFFRKIKENSLDISDIGSLVITHWHPDHMGIVSDLMRLGVRLVIFDVQLPYVHFSDAIYRRAGGNFIPVDESKATVISCKESRAFLKKMGIDGEVIHTPGHSEDSVSVVLDSGSAFVGDLPPLSSVAAFENEVLNESYKKILSLGVSRLFYGHMVSEQV